MSIAACIGIHSNAGAGAGPRHLFDGDDDSRPDIVFPSVRPCGVRAMVTDVTVTGVNPNGVNALARARQGALDPDHFVKLADKRKNTKYLNKCTDSGYGFIPCAFSSGGRPSPGAIRLFRSLVETAGDSIEPWYFYNCLLPRLFLTLAIEQYRHDKVVHDEILRRTRLSAADSPCGPCTPPTPAECAPPHSATAKPHHDTRWGPSADGRCAFVPSRVPAFESFISSIARSFPCSSATPVVA